MSMVAIFATECCKKLYVSGCYSGEREEKMAKLENYPHVFCKKHEKKTPLIFSTYVDQELCGIESMRTAPLTAEQESNLKRLKNRR